MDYREALGQINEETILKGIGLLLKGQKGGMVVFKPRKIAKILGLPQTPVVLAVIRFYLDAWVEKGELEDWGKSWHGKKYALYRTSNLWKLALEFVEGENDD